MFVRAQVNKRTLPHYMNTCVYCGHGGNAHVLWTCVFFTFVLHVQNVAVGFDWCTLWLAEKEHKTERFCSCTRVNISQIMSMKVWLTMWHFHRPSKSQFSVCSTWNMHGAQNSLEYVIFKQAIIWLFFGREVFNISRFLMDACLKGAADDKFASASSWKEPGVWHQRKDIPCIESKIINVRNVLLSRCV